MVYNITNIYCSTNLSSSQTQDQRYDSLQSDISKIFAILSNLNVNSNIVINNSSSSPTFSASSSSSFKTFNEAKSFLYRSFDKLGRYNNHIKLFDTHLENKTAPPSLFFRNFPKPFLADDEDFVNEYNDLILNFQAQIMNLCKKHLDLRIVKVNNDILKIKEDLKNDVNLEGNLSDLKNEIDAKQKDIFLKKNEQTVRVVKFKVLNNKNSNRRDNHFNLNNVSNGSNLNNSYSSSFSRSNNIDRSLNSSSFSYLRSNNNNSYRRSNNNLSKNVTFSDTHSSTSFDHSRLDFRTARNFPRNKNY